MLFILSKRSRHSSAVVDKLRCLQMGDRHQADFHVLHHATDFVDVCLVSSSVVVTSQLPLKHREFTPEYLTKREVLWLALC